MNYKLGKYILNHKTIIDFITHVCKNLNISVPNVYVINTKYSFSFMEKFYKYQDDYIKTSIKSTNNLSLEEIDKLYNPPTIDLYYYDKNFKLQKYILDEDLDCNFLGIYHIDEEEIYINLGLIYLSVATQCLMAKRQNCKHYFFTERKLSNQIKKTIMHECYHHFQKLNNLKLSCYDCDNYALKTLREDKDFLNYKLLIG